MTTSDLDTDTELERELKAKLLAKLDLTIDYFLMANENEVEELRWLRRKYGIADVFNRIAKVGGCVWTIWVNIHWILEVYDPFRNICRRYSRSKERG